MQNSVVFTDSEVQLARQLRALELPWTPMAGQFVLDESGLVERESPFQPGVFFVLNYEYFMKIAGGVDRFREIMLWLPTWEQSRELLRDMGVSDEQVAKHLADSNAFAGGNERACLYELMIGQLGPPQ
jgi:hypothetical protein